MTELNVDRYSTLAYLYENGWHAVPGRRGSITAFTRSFALMTQADEAQKAAARLAALAAGANSVLPRYTHEELHAVFELEEVVAPRQVWAATIRFKSHQPPFAHLGAALTSPVTEKPRDAVLWLRRGGDSLEVLTLATQEMRRLEAAMQLGWRP